MSTAGALPSLDDTFGCLFLAGIFATALWSASTVQLYFYYDKYTGNDKPWIKAYMFVIYALDTMHQCFLLAALYKYFVTNFANVAHLNVLERPLQNTTIGTALVDALVQILFVMRIWHLSKQNRILTGVLGVFIACQFTATVIYYVKVYSLSEITGLATVINTEIALNSVVAFVDTSIASVLAFLLHSHRSSIKQTNSLINRLMAYTISTGLLTSAMSLMALITALVYPTKFIYLIPDFVIPKLYFNSVLALYNSRQNLRNNLVHTSENGISMNNIRPFTSSGTSASHNRVFSSANAVSIKVDTERVLNIDSVDRKA
ncbi:hypothetical protein M0805_000532 [Coniferiporia weirii]|nr:hypothetical protein M0805_000532 [Coniferiporia weirii]